MPDILLIQPPIRDFYLTAKRTIPYGLACIASLLIAEGFTVEILDALATSKSRKIDLPSEMAYVREFYPGPDCSPFALFHDFKHYGYTFERIGEIARESGAFLVGISSLFTAYSDEALRTAEAVKRSLRDVVVVLGGHHPTEMPEAVLEHECVDFIIRGEGEAALPQLAWALRAGTSPEGVPGIGFRKAEGGLFLNPPAVIANLDDTLPPAMDLIDRNFYQRKKTACTVVVASRGCPLSCSYCSIGCSSWSRFRLKSTVEIMDELEREVTWAGVRFIDFEDENISFNRNWFLQLLGEIRDRFGGLGLELRAMNGLYPPTLDGEVIRAMKEAGFSALNLSLCTTCTAQLRRFKRCDVREAFEDALIHAAEHGMEAVGYIIVGAPGQSARDSLDDLLYLASKKVLAGVSVFYPAPGSADYEGCRRKDLLPPAFSLMRSTALPVSDTTTREESATLLRLGRILNFMKSLTWEEIEGVTAENPTVEEGVRGASPMGDRREAGKTLLRLFFRDGIIRGTLPDGKIFEHRTVPELCIDFRDGLSRFLREGAWGSFV